MKIFTKNTDQALELQEFVTQLTANQGRIPAFIISLMPGSSDVGDFLNTGSQLKVTAGTVEANFESGVRCVIEAPCELTVLSEDRISVTEGIAWFEVPHEAIGFTVANSGIITDNPATGTQYGSGFFTDGSFSYTVQPMDLACKGNIGS